MDERGPGMSSIRVGNPTVGQMTDDALRLRPSDTGPCRRAENSNASAMPMAIASPCSSRSEKPHAASSAWPKVWPRLSSARSPVSRSSRATIAALARQLTAIACSRAEPPEELPPANTSLQLASSQSKKAASPSKSILRHFGIAGAEFAVRQRVEQRRYRRRPGSAGGRRRSDSCRGCESMAVLPPTEELTCASSVVGTCT